MKKKILSFIFAVCLILPFSFMLSGCATKEDPNNSNIAFETIQNEFGQSLDGVGRILNNAKSFFEDDQGATPNSIYIEYSLISNWATMYSMSAYDSEVCVRNTATNEVLSNRNINESASQYEISEEALDKVIDTFYSFKFAYYNGYLINLSTGEWEAIAYNNYADDMIYFLDNYLDLYVGNNSMTYSLSTKILIIGPSGNGQDIYSIKV